MAIDTQLDRPPEHAYSYCTSLRAIGCAALVFALLGGAGAAMLPFGYEQLQAGKMPLGIALMVVGLFTLPLLFFSCSTLYTGIRDRIRPPLVRVTPTALCLPPVPRQCRPEQEKQGDRGEPKDLDPPVHPEAIPFAAIRALYRESKINPGSDRMVIVHDLAPIRLVIEQYMMHPADFDDLERVLRASLMSVAK
jgi:hypothetical protein